MKKIVLSVCTVAAMSSLVFAGGGMKEVAPVEEPVVAIPVVEELSGFYAGLGLTAVSVRDADFSVDWGGDSRFQDRLGNVSLVAGYNFNEYIAAEGRYTTSFTHEHSVEMSGWSIFVKPQYPVTEDFSVYALLGYGGVTVDGIDGRIADVDDTGFQWGLGASYMVTENVSLFADYAWLANDMDGILFNGALQTDVDAFTIGVNYHF
ncbi:outer membrane protein [Sulfurovum sp. CS9]|uniref:outer membrane protein n=1 Tax=Sulfurovum sp. CS9 TaxID=3391146 RepID=UPI0039E86139